MNTAPIKRFIKQNSSAILTVAGITSACAEAFFSIRAGRKIEKKVSAQMTLKEEVKCTWKYYIMPAIFTIGSCTCFIFAKKINMEKVLALSAATGASGKLFKEYQEKFKELYGDEALQKVKKAVAKDHEDGIEMAESPYISTNSLFSNGGIDLKNNGEDIFYLDYEQKWFRSSLFAVETALYHLNRNFALRGYASLEEFYEFLGITKFVDVFSDVIGWDLANLAETYDAYWLDFDLIEVDPLDGGKPYYILSYVYPPDSLEQ